MLTTAGSRVLTDPMLSNHRYGLRRAEAARLHRDDAAEVTMVLVSHAHRDHLHPRSLRRLPRTATLVVPPRCGALVERLGFRRVVVLERVSNPTNLGVVLRSAAGLGMDAALLDPTCSDPLYRRTARVAMGEGYGFPWAWVPRLPGGLDVLRAHGFGLIALTPDAGAVPLDELAPDGDDDPDRDRVALLLGAEGHGLSPETLAAADVRAGIPMRGGVDSLNVGVAAGIAFWVLGRSGQHWARRPAADGERSSADT